MQKILTEWRRYLNEINAKKLKQMHPEQEDVIDKADRTLKNFKLSNKYLEYLVRKTIERYADATDDEQRLQGWNMQTRGEFIRGVVMLLKRYDDLLRSGKMKAAMDSGKAGIKPVDGLNPLDITSLMRFRGIQLLKLIVQEVEGWQSAAEKKRLAKEGAEKIYEDDRYLVVHVKNKEASCLYGKGTRWCISGERDNVFDQYKAEGETFLFLIDKTTDAHDRYGRIAFVFDEDSWERQSVEDVKMFDSRDEPMKKWELHNLQLGAGLVDTIFLTGFRKSRENDPTMREGRKNPEPLQESLNPNKEVAAR
jgi:hypothetical protein